MCLESKFQIAPDWPKIRGITMTSQFPEKMLSSSFFWHWPVSPVKFSYWSKFHVNIITGSRVMTILLHTGLTRNPEVRNTPVWVLPNTWRLGWVRDTKFGTNVSNEMLRTACCKMPGLTAFTVSELLWENQQEGREVKVVS